MDVRGLFRNLKGTVSKHTLSMSLKTCVPMTSKPTFLFLLQTVQSLLVLVTQHINEGAAYLSREKPWEFSSTGV